MSSVGREQEKKSDVRIIFSSGAILDLRVDEFTATRNSITGELTGIKYPENDSKILYIDLSQIAAIIELLEKRKSSPDKFNRLSVVALTEGIPRLIPIGSSAQPFGFS